MTELTEAQKGTPWPTQPIIPPSALNMEYSLDQERTDFRKHYTEALESDLGGCLDQYMNERLM